MQVFVYKSMCARVNKVVVVVLEALESLECFLKAKYYNRLQLCFHFW